MSRGGRRRQAAGLLAGLGLLALLALSGASAAPRSSDPSQAFWSDTRTDMGRSVPPPGGNDQVDINVTAARGLRLDRDALAALLATAPSEDSPSAGRRPLTISLPAPDGGFQQFTLVQSAIMEPALAEKHPDIATYAGRGIDDPGATIHADLTPLGFHASVRSTGGAWYIDPYYHLDQSVYASYFGHAVKDDQVPFVERDSDAAEVSVDEGYYHAADTVTLSGSAFAANANVTITISDPEEGFATRTVTASTDELGNFETGFIADPSGDLETHIVAASDGDASASTSYQVVRDEDPTSDPPTGDVVRTYRLALITDPGYAAFHGGSANVTPAKVTLVNRVGQVYEDDLSIKLQLIGNNDLLNLDTWDEAIAPNGPCGAAGCFTQSQVTSCSSTTRARYVIGQIIGASNYDIGHLALGQPGGGVANLGVVGRSNKAGGCTGIPTPTGDFYAIDYVAHEMGHQFSGDHPFNGNQLNCSGGNRNASTSVEPGSGTSIMAYAGICLTDDLQAHSDPYFSQRSLQEISTYTSSSQTAIDEVQTASLRHFGGGNEVQVVTFGPGYAPASTIQPLTVNINAAPSLTSRGGAEENGTNVTIATAATHTLQVGDSVTIAGVGIADYNGTFTVTAIPSSRSFQVTNPTTGLATSGGGTVTLAVPGATESGTTATMSTSAPHNRSVGDLVTIAGVGVAGYNGTFTITAVPTPRTFRYTAAASGLASSGGGSSTFFSPFQVRIGGSDSAVMGGNGTAYSSANLTAAINAISGFAGTATVTGAASTGFTVTYTGAAAGTDVPNLELVNLSCGGCFASVEETNHGGANDSFTLDYNGSVSAPIVNGTNYSPAGILAALTPILPAGATATVAAFGGGAFNNTGFQVTFGGALAATNVPVTLALQSFSAGASGFVGETDKGGAVDNTGGTVTPSGNGFPSVTAPVQYTIPLRTPFALTGGATDPDDDPLLYSWEQNDRGGTTGTSLLNNTRSNGPLFAMFPVSGQISLSDSLQYDSPGENHLTADPARVFPDLQQILSNNTNAETGACPSGPIAPPVPQAVTECFAEFLPTSDYVGFVGVNASPLSLHFRLTARDLEGGVNSADTTLLLAPAAGPFLVTSPNAAGAVQGGSTQTVTWDVAGTDAAPVSTTDVKISLSLDGGQTFPTVLSASTPNDGSEAMTLPNVGTSRARIKVEAVGNVFFDVSNANFSIQALPVATNALGGGSRGVPFGAALSPDVTVTATDVDTPGSGLTATATGLPAGLSLEVTSTSGPNPPGSRTWKLAGNVSAAPGVYHVTVAVEDGSGGTGSTTFTIVVHLTGIVGVDSASVGQDDAVVDSYDSAAGPYGPGNKGTSALFLSNGPVTIGGAAVRGNVQSTLGPVTLQEQSVVTGDVTAGTSITNDGTIDGTATPDAPAPRIVAPAVPACSPYSSVKDKLYGKYSYNASSGDLAVSSGRVTINAGTYCFHSVKLTGGSTLRVAGPVVIRLTGQLQASGGSDLNPAGPPANLQIRTSFTRADGLAFSGDSVAHLTGYAPRTRIALSGNSSVSGALLGKTLAASGSAVIHYDVALLGVWDGFLLP